MENIEVKLKERIINIKINLFNDEQEIDIEKLLKIDVANLLSEIVTFPIVLNRLGILLAKMENQLSEKKLDLEVFEAKEKSNVVVELIKEKIKPTNDRVDDALYSSALYKGKSLSLLKTQKERDYINSIYWSAKQKADILIKMSLTLKEGDVDISMVQDEFNGVIIRKSKRSI